MIGTLKAFDKETGRERYIAAVENSTATEPVRIVWSDEMPSAVWSDLALRLVFARHFPNLTVRFA